MYQAPPPKKASTGPSETVEELQAHLSSLKTTLDRERRERFAAQNEINRTQAELEGIERQLGLRK